MKSFFTKIFFAFLITVGISQLADAQVYIWGGPGDANSEFAGGLNDWTTTENNGTYWRWDENGMADEGCYWGGGAMQSASVANGIAVFDSDKFNCVDGIAYPHRGELTSPVFSCEANSTVFVSFHQEARWWASDNKTILQVTTDGGNTWLPTDGIEVNNEIPGTNFASFTREDKKLINITEYAANAANVQIRFVWDGSYYYWLLDDVYVMEQPEVDLEVSAVLYDPVSAQVPVSQVDGRFSSFEANVNNQGSMDVTDAVVKIEIVQGSTGAVLWADSLVDVTVAAGDTSELVFENFFLGSDAIGESDTYLMRYSAYAPNVEEVNMVDNFYRKPFDVTENYYSNSYYRPSNAWGLDEVWGPYSIFYTGSWAESVPSGMVLLADTVRMAMTDSGANGGDFVADVNVYLYRVSDEVEDDFSNFEKTIPPQFDPADDAHPQLEFVGFAFESSFQGGDYDQFQLEMYNINFDRQVQLQPNSKYMLLAVWDNDNRIFHVADPGTFVNSTNVTGGWLWDSDADGVLDWDTDPWYGWNLGMLTAFGVNNTEVQLAEGVMETYPNPADNDVFVNINLEEWSADATLVLSDMQNHYINSVKVEQGSTRESMSVKNLPAGNYILRLITAEGVATKKIVVSH